MINPTQRSGPVRMMGMQSGMDTDFIIQQTLRMHQVRIDQKIRQRTLIEWRQQTHNSIRDQMREFSSSLLSMTSPRSMLRSNSYNTNRADVTGVNRGAVSITTGSSSQVGSFQILSATRATGASITSGNRMSLSNAGFSLNQRLGDMKIANGTTEGTQLTFNNDKISFNVGEGSSAQTINFEREHLPGGGFTYTATINGNSVVLNDSDFVSNPYLANGVAAIDLGNGDVLKVTRDNSGVLQRVNEDTETTTASAADSFEWGDLTNPISFTNDGVTTNITGINRNTTLSQLINAVNNSGAGITMSYDVMTDRFTWTSNTIGSAAGSFSGTGLEILAGSGPVSQSGSMAQVEIKTNNGEIVTVAGNNGGTSNMVNFGGVTININQTFSGEAVDVNVSRDIDNAFNNIKNFIDSYNTIIKRIEGLLSEQKTPAERSYLPLTDEEKRAMTDKQIADWEAIARKGIMRNDSSLQNLVRDLRNSFFSEIEGLGMRPSDLGLSTGNFFDRTGGQIFIDEDRLRAALEEDPDRVMAVFTQQGATRDQQGLVTRINSTINSFISTGGTQNNTISSLERSIRNVNEQIDRMTTRMFAEEDRLYRQFAAMETAMSRLQSQGDWFSAMLGGM